MSDALLRTTLSAAQSVYVVAGGNHVTIELDQGATDGSLDVVEVLAQPGGGPPPHSHAFGEWFLVRQGELTLCEGREGTVVPTVTLAAGDSVDRSSSDRARAIRQASGGANMLGASARLGGSLART